MLADLGWLFNPDILKFLAGGLLVTLALAALSIVISGIIGTLLALARMSSWTPVARWPWFRPMAILATCYIEVMRALPVLLVIFFCFFALPKVIGIKLSPFVAGVIAMSAFTAALIAEIVRAGVRSVPRGVVEAAVSQGLSSRDRMRLIQLPIALRRMTPALTAQFVTLLKDTSLTVVIGNLELLRRGELVYAQPPFDPIPVYALIAVTYFAVNYGLSTYSRRIEARAV